MGKVLMLDMEKCTGCRTCELVCSVKHEGAANPSKSRIKIVKWEWEGRYVPMSCQQCVDAPCGQVCPVAAITRDRGTPWLITVLLLIVMRFTTTLSR